MNSHRAVKNSSSSCCAWWGAVSVSVLYFAVIDFAWVVITMVYGPLS